MGGIDHNALFLHAFGYSRFALLYQQPMNVPTIRPSTFRFAFHDAPLQPTMPPDRLLT